MKTVFVLIGPGSAMPGKREPGTGGKETSQKIEADSIAAGGSAARRAVPGPSGRIRISDIHAREALRRPTLRALSQGRELRFRSASGAHLHYGITRQKGDFHG